MKLMVKQSSLRLRGFALPTVMITSVIMLILLLSSLQLIAVAGTAMRDRQYNLLAREAAESGVVMADACMRSGNSAWSNDLFPGSGCDGSESQCEDATCYLTIKPNVRTTFQVPKNGTVSSDGLYIKYIVEGKTELTRTSDSSVYKTYVYKQVWSTSAVAGYAGGLPVGTSLDGYWSIPPDGYLYEDGRAVSRTVYADLFAVIGTTFGAGDGSTTFNLPDSRGRTAINISSSDTEFDVLGEKTGIEEVALTANQIPAHTHTGTTGSANAISYRIVHQAGTSRSSTQFVGWTGSGGYGDSTNSSYQSAMHTHDFTTNSTGGGSAHTNVQPSIVKMSVIKYKKPVNGLSNLPAGISIRGYWSSAPDEYLDEDGSAVSRTAYSELLGAIGTNFGVGNGSTTFNLPDSRGRTVVNLDSTDTDFNTTGKKIGDKAVTLTTNQIPAHTHSGVTGSGNTMFYRIAGGESSSLKSSGWNHFKGYGSGSYTSYSDASFPTAPHTHNFTTNSTGGGESHTNIQPSIVKRSVIKYTAPSTVESVPVGTSIESYRTIAPSGYLAEDGSAVSRTVYSKLFATIGTTYGEGNGSTTFNLPDSRGRITVNLGSNSSYFSSLGAKSGVKSVTLTVDQLPAHTHTGTTGSGNSMFWRLVYTVGSSSYGNHAVGYRGTATFTDYTDANWPGSIHTHNFTTNSTGGGESHPNIQPSIVKTTYIKY